jgi:hypothetical protein
MVVLESRTKCYEESGLRENFNTHANKVSFKRNHGRTSEGFLPSHFSLTVKPLRFSYHGLPDRVYGNVQTRPT